MISTLIWKGIWDFWEIGVAGLFDTNQKYYSLLTTGLIGYSIFFLIILYQNKLLDSEMINIKNLYIKTLLMDLFYSLAFFSLNGIWFTMWSLFDNFALNSPYQTYIIILTHFISTFIICICKVGTTLYGPAGSDSNDTNNQKLIDNCMSPSRNLMHDVNNDFSMINYHECVFKIS